MDISSDKYFPVMERSGPADSDLLQICRTMQHDSVRHGGNAHHRRDQSAAEVMRDVTSPGSDSLSGTSAVAMPTASSPSGLGGLNFGSNAHHAGLNSSSGMDSNDLDLLDSKADDTDMAFSVSSLDGKKARKVGQCKVCGDEASGMYFGAMVCVPCKTFFLRYYGDNFSFVCRNQRDCEINMKTRTQCKYCRMQKCLQVGMLRRVRPSQVQITDGQQLCVVCSDLANGLHFGAITCEGCKKFFRRGLKEHPSYVCKNEKNCLINPRTRNACRYCRYQKCLKAGMCREAIQMGRPSKFRHIIHNPHLPVPKMEPHSPENVQPMHTSAGLDSRDYGGQFGGQAGGRMASQFYSGGTMGVVSPSPPHSDAMHPGMSGGHPSPPQMVSGSNRLYHGAKDAYSFGMHHQTVGGELNPSPPPMHHPHHQSPPLMGHHPHHQHSDQQIKTEPPDFGYNNGGPHHQMSTPSPHHHSYHSPLPSQSPISHRSSGGSNPPSISPADSSHQQQQPMDQFNIMNITNPWSSQTMRTMNQEASMLISNSLIGGGDGEAGGGYPLKYSNVGLTVTQTTPSTMSAVTCVVSTSHISTGQCSMANSLGGGQRNGCYNNLSQAKDEGTGGIPQEDFELLESLQRVLEENAAADIEKEENNTGAQTIEAMKSVLPVLTSHQPSVVASESITSFNAFIKLSQDQLTEWIDFLIRERHCTTSPRDGATGQTGSGAAQPAASADSAALRALTNKQSNQFNADYWLKPVLPDENIFFTEKHRQILDQITTAYTAFVEQGHCINQELTSEFYKWLSDQGYSSPNDDRLIDVDDKFNSRVVEKYTICSVVYCKNLPGFVTFSDEDKYNIVRLGQSQSRILAAACHWYRREKGDFDYFLSWKPPKSPREYKFKESCVKFSEMVVSQEWDMIECAFMNALVIVATDYTGLKNPERIDQVRLHILQAFRAYTTAKYGTPNTRIEELFSLIPNLRALGVLHHKWTMVHLLRQESREMAQHVQGIPGPVAGGQAGSGTGAQGQLQSPTEAQGSGSGRMQGGMRKPPLQSTSQSSISLSGQFSMYQKQQHQQQQGALQAQSAMLPPTSQQPLIGMMHH